MRHLVDTKKKLIESVKFLAAQPRISHDTETFNREGAPDIGGLHPFHGSRAFSHIFSDGKDEFYFDFNIGGINHKHMQLLQPIFDDPNKIIFYINAIFDNTIMHFDGLKNHARIVDGPAIARIEYNGHGKQPGLEETFLSMDYLADYYLGTNKNDEVKNYILEHDLHAKDKNGEYIIERFNGKLIPLYNEVPKDLMFRYGCSDARTTFDICTKIIQCINGKDDLYAHQRAPGFAKMIDVAKNEIQLTSELVEMKIGGLKVWTEYVEKAIAHETEKELRLTAEVKAEVGDLNLKSGKQVAEYLVSKGIPVPRKEVTATAIRRAETWRKKAGEYLEKGNEKKAIECREKAHEYAKGNYQTDAKTLQKLSEKYNLKFLDNITAAKKSAKKVGTYYKNFLKMKDSNDIIHCNLNQGTAKTGRLGCSQPNLQNLHKEPLPCVNCGEYLEDDNPKCERHSLMEFSPDCFLIRKSFIAPEPDEVLLFADYTQQEMIVMLDQAGEMGVINKLLSGEFSDFYLATASVIFEKTGLQITRKQAKAIALGLAYGQGKALLAFNLGCTLSEADDIKRAFFAALPALKNLDKRLKNEARRTGKIHNPFGRVTYIAKDKDYTALNAFVQGTSADITKVAMVNIAKKLREAGLKSKISLCVHDEVVLRTKVYELEQVKKIVSAEMAAAYPHKYIGLGVDFEISKQNKYGVSSWGEKEKVAA